MEISSEFREEYMIPMVIITAATLVFFVAERVLPGRELPEAPGWYLRAAFLNACQFGIVVTAGAAWNRWMRIDRYCIFRRQCLPSCKGCWGGSLVRSCFIGGTERAMTRTCFGAFATRFITAPGESS
jgi:hypothetical protein